jgi:hypothetical protein
MTHRPQRPTSPSPVDERNPVTADGSTVVDKLSGRRWGSTAALKTIFAPNPTTRREVAAQLERFLAR